MFESAALSHPVSDGEQKRLSAFPLVPLTTLCPPLPHTQRTVSPTWMVRLAGVNANAPPLPTMTVCVPAASVVVGPGGAVGATGVVVVVAPVQLPALQLSQQLGTAPAHAEPPLGAVHLASFGFSKHFVLPVAAVRQHVTKPGRPQVDCLAHLTTCARHCFGRAPLFAAVFATPATHRTYALCPLADSQGHCWSAVARTDVTAPGSVQAARALPTESRSATTMGMEERFMTSPYVRAVGASSRDRPGMPRWATRSRRGRSSRRPSLRRTYRACRGRCTHHIRWSWSCRTS